MDVYKLFKTIKKGYTMLPIKPTKFDANSPDTKEQAEELLKEYYKQHKTDLPPAAKRPDLLSWKLNEDGVMSLVDGASGRQLTFEPPNYQAKEQAEELAEDAEQAALDAEAELAEARKQVLVAEQKAKVAEQKAKTAQEKAKAAAKADKFGPKGATDAANKKRDEEAKAKAEAEAKAKAKAGK